MKIILISFLAWALVGCAAEETTRGSTNQTTLSPEEAARQIIVSATTVNGLDTLTDAIIDFRFRDRSYRYERRPNGYFRYSRSRNDTTDVLTNDGLKRYAGTDTVALTEKKRGAYGRSVNSVIYFAFMPWALNDPAARPHYDGLDTIKGETLDRIYVSFSAEQGGKDFEDQFYYWFTPDDRRQLKYLAYVEPENKAPRFRQAFNERRLPSGMVVRDYYNYTTMDRGPMPLERLAELYNTDSLMLLSTIALEEVAIITEH